MNKIMGKVAISNRHVHLTKEVYEKLFDEELKIKKNIGQIGEFAAEQVVTLKGPKGEIKNVRVMGPFRDYNQVEVSVSDAYILGINPPVRKSGDLENSEDIIIYTSKKEVTLKSVCIISERHVHMNEDVARNLGLNDEEVVNLKVDNIKGGVMNSFVKVKPNGYFEVHLDYDDANAFLLKNGDLIEIEKINK